MSRRLSRLYKLFALSDSMLMHGFLRLTATSLCPSSLPASRTATFANSPWPVCATLVSPAETCGAARSACTRSTTVLGCAPLLPSLNTQRSHWLRLAQPDELELIRRDYTANGGWETFLSYEDPERDILVGLLRLRKLTPEGTFREELVKDGQTSMVRELHGERNGTQTVKHFSRDRLADCPRVSISAVYGTAVPLHSRDPTLFQHQGIGTLLMEEAERIAREEHGSRKIAVISGIGVRSYYARLGYKLEGPYMTCVFILVELPGMKLTSLSRLTQQDARPARRRRDLLSSVVTSHLSARMWLTSVVALYRFRRR